MKKVLGVIILVIMVVGLAYLGFTCASQASCIKTGVDNTPDLTERLYPVETSSRVYYAREYKETETEVTLIGYYEVSGGKWVFRDGSIVLNKAAFGGIKVGKLSELPSE